MNFNEAFEIFSYPFFKLIRMAHEIHIKYWDEQTV